MADVSSSSPLPSPHGTSQARHATLNAARSPITKTSSPTQAHTPRPNIMSRHTSHFQQTHPADSSPNYFNLSLDNSKTIASSTLGVHARSNWSPPSSRVRSTAAISPLVLPLDQNPEYAEFRRQSDLHSKNNGFNFGAFATPAKPTLTSRQSTGAARQPSSPTPSTRGITTPPSRGINGSLGIVMQDEKPRSPKRTLSSPYCNIPDRPRRNSPAGFTDRESAGLTVTPQELGDDDIARFSLPPITSPLSAPQGSYHAATFPPVKQDMDLSDPDAPNFVSPSHVVTLLDSHEDEVLLLDVRVSTQYARSRIHGALSLCIPTTLLKRPSYNTQKLAETFNRNLDQKKKFECWRNCQYIIVYDGSASKLKDATVCVNMLKKFATEGWTGQSYVICGGYTKFAKQFPNLIQYDQGNTSSSDSNTSSSDSSSGSLAPVIGGCPMPATKSAANPFFGNIRQNMDLIGGVGQISVKKPDTMVNHDMSHVPKWLRDAAHEADNGKVVADKFLAIEKLEQRRMQQALSGNVNYNEGTPNSIASPIQIAGIEKGSKNRYNNIFPFEQSRVKLQGHLVDGCDYVNANHIKASWSNKRYIATQAPIPATFTDFWNVVWQQDVRVIVMLTAESESGQIKAHNYWNQTHFGPLHLTHLSEHRASLEPSRIHKHKVETTGANRRCSSTNPIFDNPSAGVSESEGPSADQPYVIVRRFTLTNDSAPFERMREITQLQYSHWPDFGAPAHPAHLLGLVEQCDLVVRSNSRSGPQSEDVKPIVVHCSAGCGRTGTFCTVDSVIDMIKRQRMVNKPNNTGRMPTPMEVETDSSGNPSQRNSMDTSSISSGNAQDDTSMTGSGERDWLVNEEVDLIEKTVEDFRHQRLSMVQSLRQYVLCYESILEWLVEQTPKSA